MAGERAKFVVLEGVAAAASGGMQLDGFDGYASVMDDRTRTILERRRRTAVVRRRGWLVRRALLLADVAGLAAAFAAAHLLFGATGSDRALLVYGLCALALPFWILLAKLHGLYERDEERTDHSTIDDIVGVFHFVTTGAWLSWAFAWIVGVGAISVVEALSFWAFALVLVTTGRAMARATCQRSITYLQNTVIVGAGDVGQLVARKLLHHPEYGINLVGFVDANPREMREDLTHVPVIGTPDDLSSITRAFDVERVIVAFSNEANDEILALVRSLKDAEVQVDIVPRLFEVVGPNVGIHTVEGLPLVGLPPVRLSRSSMLVKRTIDVVGALVGLALTAPLFAYIALRIKRDSPGPVFFRQTRLGANMAEFTLLKFRTMKVDTDDTPHREFIKELMNGNAAPASNGLFKLSREDAITPFGRFLRKTSLDELPQLLNVLRGDMSLVGPRPCIPYEAEHFAPHHFERFLVPAGVTGFWQVTARAHTTFAEALDMDVTYARSWSLGLDLTLMLRTVRHLLGKGGTA
jgi:exopolysaccharide biosynthesis polyprenyl glycosylphosphotransferase